MLQTQAVEPRTFSLLNNIKVDFVHFPHLPIAAIEEEEKIRFYSIADISAMKIQAILGRAQKKDFWDLFEILQHYPLQQLIDWHKQKYPNQMLAISLSLIHISEPTRLGMISYAVFCLKKK